MRFLRWSGLTALIQASPNVFFLSKICFPLIQGKQLWHHSSFSCAVTLQVHTTLNMGQTAVLLGYLFFGKKVCAMALWCCDPGAQWRASSMLVLKPWKQWKEDWSKFSAAWRSKQIGRQAFILSRLMVIRINVLYGRLRVHAVGNHSNVYFGSTQERRKVIEIQKGKQSKIFTVLWTRKETKQKMGVIQRKVAGSFV